MKCVWDPAKNVTNLSKHGLGFEEAALLFDLPEHLILEAYDFEHSQQEDRVVSIGPIARGVIVVISTEWDDGETLRLISARFASTQERQRYANHIAGV